MYYFFLGELMLPVAPPKMAIRIGNKNKTVSLIDDGEINIIKSPGLREISFDAFLPNAVYPFADYSGSLTNMGISAFFGNSYSYQPAEHFLTAVDTAKKTKAPIRFIITRLKQDFSLLWDTNTLVTVEECPINEDAKQGNDVIIPLRLKEYKPYATKELEVTKDANGKETYTVKQDRFSDAVKSKNWRITKEKSIFEAVKLARGGGLDWRTVMNLNGLTNPIDMTKRQVLRLE